MKSKQQKYKDAVERNLRRIEKCIESDKSLYNFHIEYSKLSLEELAHKLSIRTEDIPIYHSRLTKIKNSK